MKRHTFIVIVLFFGLGLGRSMQTPAFLRGFAMPHPFCYAKSAQLDAISGDLARELTTNITNTTLFDRRYKQIL